MDSEGGRAVSDICFAQAARYVGKMSVLQSVLEQRTDTNSCTGRWVKGTLLVHQSSPSLVHLIRFF